MKEKPLLGQSVIFAMTIGQEKVLNDDTIHTRISLVDHPLW